MIQDNSFKILKTYYCYNKLIKRYPFDTGGDCYLVNGVLYFWDDDVKIFENCESIVELIGPSERINVEDTTTTEPGTEANFYGFSS